MKKIVLIDPGHGGRDPGAVANGLEEKTLNLLLAMAVANRLKKVDAVLTRERDCYFSLADRVAMSRRIGPDLFISLHANAGGGRGFESFVSSGLAESDPARLMQAILHGRVISFLRLLGIVDRGCKEAGFYVLKHNLCPAVLIESLFVDNAREAELWQDGLFVEELAGNVARGIEEALGQGSSGDLFTVQVGAFAFEANARQRLDDARAAGFDDAFIRPEH